MPFAYGHDMTPRWNFDGLGYTLIALAITWTAILVGGIVFLLIHRDLPFFRMRDIPLTISAVATLHVYWCLCMLAYVLNGNFPCATEFWIMSIYLPLGIALHQANSTQLRHIAGIQSRFAGSDLTLSGASYGRLEHHSWRKPVAKWRSITATKRAITCIGVGMGVQLIVSLVIFLISKKFHAGWGLVGRSGSKLACRRGWEWWPSIVWQFFWAWIYAPYLLWKVRRVQDIQRWRLQTILCSLAGLPASPLWLTALYNPMFADIDMYFIPPMWFSPCIFVIEACVIFIPCWQVLENRKLKRETLHIIKEWEEKKNKASYMGSDSIRATRRSLISHKESVKSATSSRRGEMYTMTALEKALETNPTPLLLFSSFRDFSGENIQFLTNVHQWKARWNPSSTRNGLLRKTCANSLEGEPLRCEQYSSAVHIYSSFVSLQYSNFPINLSSAHHKELGAMFDGAAALVNAHLPEDAVTPFNSCWSSTRSEDLECGSRHDKVSIVSTILTNSAVAFFPPSKSKESKITSAVDLSSPAVRVPSFVKIPDSFGPRAFDNAEESIKYMVLTNTWPKFVAAGFATTVDKRSAGVIAGQEFALWLERLRQVGQLRTRNGR